MPVTEPRRFVQISKISKILPGTKYWIISVIIAIARQYRNVFCGVLRYIITRNPSRMNSAKCSMIGQGPATPELVRIDPGMRQRQINIIV